MKIRSGGAIDVAELIIAPHDAGVESQLLFLVEESVTICNAIRVPIKP